MHPGHRCGSNRQPHAASARDLPTARDAARCGPAHLPRRRRLDPHPEWVAALMHPCAQRRPSRYGGQLALQPRRPACSAGTEVPSADGAGLGHGRETQIHVRCCGGHRLDQDADVAPDHRRSAHQGGRRCVDHVPVQCLDRNCRHDAVGDRHCGRLHEQNRCHRDLPNHRHGSDRDVHCHRDLPNHRHGSDRDVHCHRDQDVARGRFEADAGSLSLLEARPATRRTPAAVAARVLHEGFRQRPTLPGEFPPSTIGAGRLNFRVRNGNGCGPAAIATRDQDAVDIVARTSAEVHNDVCKAMHDQRS